MVSMLNKKKFRGTIFIFSSYRPYNFLYIFTITGLQADPYVEVHIGNKKLNSRDNYVPNSLDPVFGQ
jgi:hypothetical protein